MDAETRIKHADLVATIRTALASAGVPPPVRDIEAEVMGEADLLGVPSHGIRMLPGLIQGIREGRCNPDPRLTVLRERGATCVLDGDNGPGRYVSVRGMQSAIERARDHGVGVCLATHVSHWGRAHTYAYRAALAGMIGTCTTNAIPNMLAWGSSRPLLANNPLAIGVPLGDTEHPLILDMAMSQAAVGKVGTYLREGKKVPLDWGLDANGQPTDDPAAILASRRLVPLGGYKGAGLALMMEMLTGALAGAMLSNEIAAADSSGLDPNSTKFFMALDIRSFVDKERFAERVHDFLAYIESAAPGLEITLPGERGWKVREQYLAQGIPVHADIIAQLAAAGINMPA